MDFELINVQCFPRMSYFIVCNTYFVSVYQEPFIQACVTFLKRRCPSIMGGLAPDKEQPKSAQLPPETLATMLACLQSCAGYNTVY